MHTRRMAAFLLGVWIGCGVLMALLQSANQRMPAQLLLLPSDPVTQILKKLTPEDARLLLRYEAVEENRRYVQVWQEVELGLGLAVGLCLLLGTQKRVFPIVCCGLMLVFVVFQLFAITPEMTYRGREADFPPGNAAFGTQTRAWALDGVYIVTESAKLLLGLILISYLFVFRTRQRSRRELNPVPREDDKLRQVPH